MRFLWIAFLKDWQRVRRDPFSIGTALAIPVVLAVLLSLVFGGSGEARPQGRLLVDDEDGTVLSNAILSAFQRDPLDKMLTVEKVPAAAGRDRINRGDASALLIIPKNFQVNFITNQPANLQLLTNPSESILPSIVKETLSILVDAGFYIEHIAGDQLRALKIDNAPPPDALVSSMAVSFNHLATSLQRYLNPPVIGLETTVTAENRHAVNFAATFLPSMIFMGLLLVAGSLALDIWRERTLGTLRRIAVSPVPISSYLLGRVLYVGIVFGLMAALGLGAARGLAGMPVPNPAGAVLWMIFTGSAFYLVLLFLTMVPSTPRGASVMSNLITLPLAMIGGCFFPFEWMPDWMARIGRLTPNGWAIVQFKSILAGSIDWRQLAIAIAGLSAVGILGFALSLRRLRHGFVN